MARTSRPEAHVTDAELALLQALWAGGEATVRELTERTDRDGAASAVATVQKLLDRLETKGFVGRATSGRPKRYRALVDRDALVARRLEETADRLCEGSFTPLVTQLVDARRLSHDDIRTLRELVDRLAGEDRT